MRRLARPKVLVFLMVLVEGSRTRGKILFLIRENKTDSYLQASVLFSFYYIDRSVLLAIFSSTPRTNFIANHSSAAGISSLARSFEIVISCMKFYSSR